MNPAAPSPRARVILLGASNLAIGLPQALAATRATISTPINVFTAIGRGRSLGTWSSVFGRSLPGILQSSLWDFLESEKSSPHPRESFALITDVGNDILYGVPIPRIIEWVAEIIRRLQTLNASIILALPPIERINRLSPATFLLARTLIYPRRRIKYRFAMDQIRQLTNDLQSLAGREQFTTIAPPIEWYGLDPVHIRRSVRIHAWQHILSLWRSSTSTSQVLRQSVNPITFRQAIRLKTHMPAHWRFLGINVRTRNPQTHTFAGDSTIQLF